MTTLTLLLIKDEGDYDSVLERINQLFDATPGTAEGHELELLLRLVDTYQRKNDLLPEVEPTEVIKFILRQQGLTLTDITHLFGGEPIASQMMSGQKPLTPQIINALSLYLHIPIGALV